jgi:uncharacterized protein
MTRSRRDERSAANEGPGDNRRREPSTSAQGTAYDGRRRGGRGHGARGERSCGCSRSLTGLELTFVSSPCARAAAARGGGQGDVGGWGDQPGQLWGGGSGGDPAAGRLLSAYGHGGCDCDHHLRVRVATPCRHAEHRLASMGAFDDLAGKKNVVVTTYKRDGTAVPTAVHVVVLGEHAYFRTWSTSGKAKRLRRNPQVLIAPSTARGKPTGPAVTAAARLLEPEEEQPVRQALVKKYPLLQGRLVPLAHRLRHYNTVHYELTAS